MPTFRFPRINSGSKVHVFMNAENESAAVTALQKRIHEPADSDVTQCTTSSSASEMSERPTVGSLLYLSDDDDDDSADHTKSHTDDHTAASPYLYGTQHVGDGDDVSTTHLTQSHPHHFEYITLPPANPGRTVESIPTGSSDQIKKSSSYSHIHRILDEKNNAAMLTATTASSYFAGPSHHHRVRSEVPKMTLQESDSFSTDEDDSQEGFGKPISVATATIPLTRPRHRRTGSEVLVRSAGDRRNSSQGLNSIYSSTEGVKPALPAYNSPKISSGQSASKTLTHLHSTLQMRLHRFGANHPQVAEMWNRLGNYFYRSRSYDQALECYREAVRCCTSSNSGGSESNDMDDTAGEIASAAASSSLDQLATAYRNMGAVHWATGKADLAIPCLHKALDVYDSHSKAFSSQSSKHLRLAVASTWYQLGLALTLQQSYDPALEALWHAKSIREQALSPMHIEVGRTVDAIGKVFFCQENYDAALKCHQDALELKRNAAAANKKRMSKPSTSSLSSNATSGVVTSLMNIAAVHQVRGESSQAIHLYEQVLHMQMAALAQGRSSSGHKSWLHVRAALEVGETLLLLSDLYYSKRSSGGTHLIVKAHRLCKEAKFVYREAGLDEQHPQMQMADQRYQQQQEEHDLHPLR